MKMTSVEKYSKNSSSAVAIPKCLLPSFNLYIDEERYSLINAINSTSYKLQQCGWYYADMTREKAKEILHDKPIGSFILRQSSEAIRNYTISVKTQYGAVVSIRIMSTYKSGRITFHLDCSRKITDRMLEEGCVVDLVQQLITTRTLNVYRFSDNKGHRNISLQLKKPVSLSPVSLKHLCRTQVHKYSQLTLSTPLSIDKLPIPLTLKGYLSDYTNFV
ncbi:SOCS2 [Bugula neritina]|uniref:SOCS2 n=1 Tax=Bugula neritina TaxID=10212 RepID=A0A7J7J7L6_BUGNE|nr:SOCS2 [Bugula neritina]KAF6037053.1 SOCS2 [Bugula neritina]